MLYSKQLLFTNELFICNALIQLNLNIILSLEILHLKFIICVILNFKFFETVFALVQGYKTNFDVRFESGLLHYRLIVC